MKTQLGSAERLLTEHLSICVSRPLLVHHVAKRIGRSRRMVRHLARTGKLPAHKVGPKIWHFRASDVDEFKAKRTSAGYTDGEDRHGPI